MAIDHLLDSAGLPPVDVDIDRALARTVHRGRSRRRRRTALAALGAVVAVVGVGAGAARLVGSDGADRVTAASPGTTDAAPPSEPPGSQEIQVSPDTALEPGTVVTVVGGGFPSGAQVGVAQCSSAVVERPDPDYCDLRGSVNTIAEQDGSFEVDLAVSAHISTPSTGLMDCRQSSDTCVLGAAVIGSPEEAATATLSFAPGAGGREEAAIAVVGTRETSAGVVVIIKASHFLPGEAPVVSVCLVQDSALPDLANCDYDRSLQLDIDGEGSGSGELVLPVLQTGSTYINCATSRSQCIVTTGLSTAEPVSVRLSAQ